MQRIKIFQYNLEINYTSCLRITVVLIWEGFVQGRVRLSSTAFEAMKFSSTRCRNEVAFMGVLLQVALSKAVFPKDMFGPPLPSTEDEIMQQANRKVGTCVSNVQADLRWGIESTVSTQWGCNFKSK